MTAQEMFDQIMMYVAPEDKAKVQAYLEGPLDRIFTCKQVAEDVLDHCYGPTAVDDGMIWRAAGVVALTLSKRNV